MNNGTLNANIITVDTGIFTGAGPGIYSIVTSSGIQMKAGQMNVNGIVGVNTASPRATVDIVATDAVVMPSGTSAQRPATPAAGMIRYNSTLKGVEAYQGNTALWSLMLSTVVVVTYCGSGCTYTSGTTYTPPVNLVAATVECVGAGGGGGGVTGTAGAAAAGGGGGGYVRKTFTYGALSANPLVTISTGANGGAITGTAGMAANNTTFGLC